MDASVDWGDDAERTLFKPLRAAESSNTATPIAVAEIGSLGGINPVIAAANPLLVALPSLRSPRPPKGDASVVRRNLIDAIETFYRACARQHIIERDRNLASYALCAVVDEFVQGTPWGAGWAQSSLLIHFHGDNLGGTKFFEFMDRMSKDPSAYRDLLELYYVCLSLGFAGQFGLEGAMGQQKLGQIRDKLYNDFVRRQRGDFERSLSVHWRGVEVEAKRFKGYGIAGASAAAMALTCFAVYAFLALTLSSSAADVGIDRLKLSVVPRNEQAFVPAKRARLRDRLAPEIEAGQAEVADLRDQSIVIVQGDGLFDTGQAVLSSAGESLVRSIAVSLAEEPGAIVVTGHTDNVRLTSLRFHSNQHLSEERARNVAAILGEVLGETRSIAVEGRGDAEPRSEGSNDTPEGRRSNRRVEIMLKVENPDS